MTEPQTLIASKFADAIKTLRASGRSDESITRTLGLTGQQALEHGLRHHADPDAAEKLKAKARPDGAPDVATIIRGGSARDRIMKIASRMLQFHESTDGAAADLREQFDSLRPDEREWVLVYACQSIVRMSGGELRRSGAGVIKDRGWAPDGAEGASMAARLRNMGSAYDWPLPGGKSMGGATLADLDGAIKFHDTHIAGHSRSRALYQKVRDRLAESGKATVAEAINATDLEALQKEASP